MESHRPNVVKTAQGSNHLDISLLRLSVKGPLREMGRLLRQGANPNALGEHGRTPLSYAAEFRQLEIVKLLLHWGAAVDSQDRSRRTPLTWAAEADAPRVVDMLLRHGAEANFRDKRGWTALFWGALGGAPLVLELLLQGGADPTIRDTQGLSALLVAESNNVNHIDRIRIVMRRLIFPFPWQDASLLKLTGLEKRIFTRDWDVKPGWDWGTSCGCPYFFNSQSQEITAHQLATERFRCYGDIGPWSRFASCREIEPTVEECLDYYINSTSNNR